MTDVRELIRLEPTPGEYDEIRELWRWIDARINGGVAAADDISDEVSDIEFPIILAPEHVKAVALAETAPQSEHRLGDNFTWDAGL